MESGLRRLRHRDDGVLPADVAAQRNHRGAAYRDWPTTSRPPTCLAALPAAPGSHSAASTPNDDRHQRVDSDGSPQSHPGPVKPPSSMQEATSRTMSCNRHTGTGAHAGPIARQVSDSDPDPVAAPRAKAPRPTQKPGKGQAVLVPRRRLRRAAPHAVRQAGPGGPQPPQSAGRPTRNGRTAGAGPEPVRSCWTPSGGTRRCRTSPAS